MLFTETWFAVRVTQLGLLLSFFPFSFFFFLLHFCCMGKGESLRKVLYSIAGDRRINSHKTTSKSHYFTEGIYTNSCKKFSSWSYHIVLLRCSIWTRDHKISILCMFLLFSPYNSSKTDIKQWLRSMMKHRIGFHTALQIENGFILSN